MLGARRHRLDPAQQDDPRALHFALGSNEEATRLSGVNVDRWKIAVYAVYGLFAGLAGIIIAARMNSAQPGLSAWATSSTRSRRPSSAAPPSPAARAASSAPSSARFLISTLRIGLSVAGVPDQWKPVITGLVVIGAVWLDILRRRAQA